MHTTIAAEAADGLVRKTSGYVLVTLTRCSANVTVVQDHFFGCIIQVVTRQNHCVWIQACLTLELPEFGHDSRYVHL